MSTDFKKAAEDFMSSGDGRKLAGKKDEIERLASSKDGETVRSILQKGGFGDAVKSGDTEAIKKAINNVVNTDAGARLLQQLQKMMGNK